jgi:hypothetical protein
MILFSQECGRLGRAAAAATSSKAAEEEEAIRCFDTQNAFLEGAI